MVPASQHESALDTWRAAPHPPAWVAAQLRVPATMHHAVVDLPADLAPAAFEAEVTATYHELLSAVAADGTRAVRFWSFIPGIHDDLGDGLDRYMVFNAGRHAEFAAHFGAATFARGAIPTASAVGITGSRLHVYCLAADVAADAVENPRQIPAYRYSRRFGPRPPSFARATRLSMPDAPPVLLVGGTASIRGEDSLNTGDLAQQLQETLLNLAAVVAAAAGTPPPADTDAVRRCLSHYVGLRAYCLRETDHDTIAAAVADAVVPGCARELVPATMCRPELLVEIEGVAVLPAAAGDVGA